ncbi:hypothetical protein EON65_27605 [archaeon]|nr:MAG: hypothetical protein EON65_27605 [archaeon]
MLGSYKLTNGCLLRYSSTNQDCNQGICPLNRVVTDITDLVVRADANYQLIPNPDYSSLKSDTDSNNNYKADTSNTAYIPLIPSPNAQPQWIKLDKQLFTSQDIAITVEGDVSLCQAYLPRNNVYNPEKIYNDSNSNYESDYNGQLIPIPRVSDTTTAAIPLILNAQNGAWGNALELYFNDLFEVYIGNQQTNNQVNLQNRITLQAGSMNNRLEYTYRQKLCALCMVNEEIIRFVSPYGRLQLLFLCINTTRE